MVVQVNNPLVSAPPASAPVSHLDEVKKGRKELSALEGRCEQLGLSIRLGLISPENARQEMQQLIGEIDLKAFDMRWCHFLIADFKRAWESLDKLSRYGDELNHPGRLSEKG